MGMAGGGNSETALRRAHSGGRRGGNWLTLFPLLIIPVLIYNIIGVLGGGGPEGAKAVQDNMMSAALTLPMPSSAVWTVTWGEILVLIALFLLFVELLKSTGTGTMEIFNHGLSMVVFIICLIEFLLTPWCATSTFFLIMTMSLLDTLAGMIVTIVSARRDVEFDR